MAACATHTVDSVSLAEQKMPAAATEANAPIPAANHIEGTTTLFGNFSIKPEWRDLPTAEHWIDDKLFLRALRFVTDETSTRSIDNDGYPVQLTKVGLIPGTYSITIAPNSRHTRIITNTDFSKKTSLPFIVKSSTAPVRIRSLYQETLLDMDWPSRETKFFLSFRWPLQINQVWVLLDANQHPRYSHFYK
jgi:hypothetical protein